MLPTLYVPLAQREPDDWSASAVLTMKTMPGQRARVERDLATALTQAEPTVVFTSLTFDQLVDATAAQERLIAMRTTNRCDSSSTTVSI